MHGAFPDMLTVTRLVRSTAEDLPHAWNSEWPFPDNGVACCTFINHYSLYRGIQEQVPFGNFDHVFVDGALLARQLSVRLRTHVRRISFDASSVAWTWIAGAARRGYRLRIVGGSASDAEAFRRHLAMCVGDVSLGGHDVVDGYGEFDPVAEVGRFDPHHRYFVIFGTGTPLQEKQAVATSAAMRNASIPGVVLTCGGFITQTAMAVDCGGRFYPTWVENLGIRWLYRAARQPYVLGRLLRIYPRSIAMVARAQI